jgi:3-oxoadipyl-CoA thiolase
MMPDAFICDGVRTPIGRYGGALAKVRTDDLAAVPIKALMARNPNVDWAALDEVISAAPTRPARTTATSRAWRAARGPAGLGARRHRQPAVRLGARCGGHRGAGDPAGEIDFAIAGGVESMTRAPLVMGKAQEAFQRSADIDDTTIGWRFINPLMKKQYGVDSMPETARTSPRSSRWPQGPGRLRAALAAARGEGAGRGLLRRGDRAGRGAGRQGPDR